MTINLDEILTGIISTSPDEYFIALLETFLDEIVTVSIGVFPDEILYRVQRNIY